MTGLAISGLTRRFGAQIVLDGIDVGLGRGRVLSVLGPSGCGKSTLLALVAGLDRPDAGTIALGGRLLAGPGIALPPERRGINMVFQDYALWPHMSVARIVGYGLEGRGIARADREARVRRLLALMRIEALADRFPAQLSGGQQQRVAIARALATEPELLLLDEPLSNLDVQLRQDMRIELADLFARLGTTAVYVTHDPLEACTLSHEVLVLRDGRIEDSGAPESLFARPRTPWVAMLAGFDTRLPARIAAPHPDGTADLAVGTSTIRARLPQGGRPGDPGELMLHPGNLLLAGDDGAGNRLAGRVARRLFEGRHWRLTVEVAGGGTLSVQSDARPAIGDAVAVAFAPEDAVAFARPPHPVEIAAAR